jgi:hypothetical protein
VDVDALADAHVRRPVPLRATARPSRDRRAW